VAVLARSNRVGRRQAVRWFALATLPFALLVVFVAVLCDVYRVAGQDADGRADGAIVLGAAQWNGAPSPVFRARLDHAAELWRVGRVQWVIVTGGIARGDELSESNVGADYLVQRGLPPARVIAEAAGANTEASLTGAARRMRSAGLGSALLVSDPYHMKRALRIADDLGLKVAGSPVRDGPYADAPLEVLRQSARETAGFLIYVSVGPGRLTRSAS
jgi:uncharacterized SAM-binding protein YcdF (DUF218 family)